MDAEALERRIAAAVAARAPAAALADLAGREDVDGREALRSLSRLQDGQFATAQAKVLTVTRHGLASLAATGQIVDVRRGIWRWAPVPGVADPAVTAWLACWPHGVISHLSAAAHHGLVEAPGPLPEVTVGHAGPSRAPAGMAVHVSRSLPVGDVLRVGGVTYTSLARTVCDLATATDHVGTLARVDDAIAAGASRRWLHGTASRLSQGRDGVALVRDATSAAGAAEFRSWLERRAATVFAEGGLPAPAWNVRVRDRRGPIGTVDCLWDGDVVGELEGLRFHTSPTQRRRDARRFNRLLAARYVVRRFTWRDVVEAPDEVVATIARALADARRTA